MWKMWQFILISQDEIESNMFIAYTNQNDRRKARRDCLTLLNILIFLICLSLLYRKSSGCLEEAIFLIKLLYKR